MIRRIYLVVWEFGHAGGLERHVTDLALSLAHRGLEVVVFTELPAPDSNGYVAELRQAGVRVVAPGWIFGIADRIGRWTLLRSIRGILTRLFEFAHRARPSTRNAADELILARNSYRPLVRRGMSALSNHAILAPPDIVHVHGSRLALDWALEWSAARGYPAVYTEHTTIQDWGGPHRADSRGVVDIAADALACVSESGRASLRSELPGPREIALTRHIVRAPLRTPPDRVPRATTRILCVARLAREKGVDVLIDAIRILAREPISIEVLIAGDGAERKNLESLVSQGRLGRMVRFLGEIAHSRVHQLWDEVDFGVIPSRTEALPLCVIEAMAHGKAIAGTRVGGIPELIRDEENGLLAPPEDPGALAAAMKRLIENPELRRRMGDASRARFENGEWSEECAIAETMIFYSQARERRLALETVLTRGALWIRNQTRESAAQLRHVGFSIHGLRAMAETQDQVAEQAVALAGADVEVFVDSSHPADWSQFNAARMRLAGVRESRCLDPDRQNDTRVHAHGPGWTQAATLRPFPQSARRESETPGETTPLRIAYVCPDEETSAIIREFDSARRRFPWMTLTRIGECGCFVEEPDLVMVSTAIASFPIVLAAAFSMGKPVVICGAADHLPIGDRVNSVMASLSRSGSLAEALLEVASDSSLRIELQAGSRRVSATAGWRELAIVNQASAQYGPEQPHGAAVHAAR